jgi:hypothetical protein
MILIGSHHVELGAFNQSVEPHPDQRSAERDAGHNHPHGFRRHRNSCLSPDSHAASVEPI